MPTKYREPFTNNCTKISNNDCYTGTHSLLKNVKRSSEHLQTLNSGPFVLILEVFSAARRYLIEVI